VEHSNIQIFIISLIIAVAVVGRILAARGGKEIFVRRIPGLNAVDEAVGRATEMGRPIIFSPGLGDFSDPQTFPALAALGYVARLAAKIGARVIVAVFQPVVVPVAEDILKQAYSEAGKREMYQDEDVRYLSTGQDTYALAVTAIMEKEAVASAFFFGGFGFESLILTETGQRLGAIQVAGTASYNQIPFFIASCDYTVIGEELFAAGAYLGREPTMLGSVVGQDYGKLVVLALIIIGVVVVTAFGPATVKDLMRIIGDEA
jgi:hypothetical protein